MQFQNRRRDEARMDQRGVNGHGRGHFVIHGDHSILIIIIINIIRSIVIIIIRLVGTAGECQKGGG